MLSVLGPSLEERPAPERSQHFIMEAMNVDIMNDAAVVMDVVDSNSPPPAPWSSFRNKMVTQGDEADNCENDDNEYEGDDNYY